MERSNLVEDPSNLPAQTHQGDESPGYGAALASVDLGLKALDGFLNILLKTSGMSTSLAEYLLSATHPPPYPDGSPPTARPSTAVVARSDSGNPPDRNRSATRQNGRGYICRAGHGVRGWRSRAWCRGSTPR